MMRPIRQYILYAAAISKDLDAPKRPLPGKGDGSENNQESSRLRCASHGITSVITSSADGHGAQARALAFMLCVQCDGEDYGDAHATHEGFTKLV
jgi:hypothetical protein